MKTAPGREDRGGLTTLGASKDGESTATPLLLFGALLLGLVLTLTAAVGLTAHRSSSDAIDALWTDSANQLLARVVLHVRSIFEPAVHFGRYSDEAFRAGRLDPGDTDQLFDHLNSSIEAFPTIVWASYGTPSGQYLSVYRWPTENGWEIRRTHRIFYPDDEQTWFREDVRLPDGSWKSIRNERSEPYDPRTKPWFKVAASQPPDTEHWSGPVTFFSRKQVGAIYSRASHTPDGELVGVWAAEFEAAPVAQYLGELDAPEGTAVYVLDQHGTIIARPDGPLVDENGLLQATKVDDPVLSSVWRAIESTEARESEPLELEEHVAMFRDMPSISGLPWMVIVSIPRNILFAETRDQARFATVIGVVGVLLSILLMVAAGVTLRRFVRSRIDEAVAATKVGQYTLVSKLGSGGMGDVFRAEHALLRRPTAVKLLQSSLGSPIDIQRFEHEVQMTCRLSHPNTITIFDYGQTPDGRFYYAMELIDGASLLELVKFAGPLPPGRVIHIAEQVCAALAEAHDSGLVHRDIKPANILVAEIGGRSDFVKVVDFGLVKDVSMNAEALTQDGSFAGTPGFLAPEVPVSPQMVGPVTDIYSVGAVIYVMLTASLPHHGDSGMAIFLAQQTSDPVPPSQRIEREIPPDLEALCLRCMARNPEERPTSASELRELLLACVDAGTWTDEMASEWWRRNGERVGSTPEDRTIERTTIIATKRLDGPAS